jgi:hypothetical protein
LPGEGRESYAVDADSLRLLARHYPFTLKAKRVSGDPAVKKVWDLCVNSLRYGVQEEVHDCMDREKAQYLGDGLYSSLAHGIATGGYELFEKLIADWLRSAAVTPGLMSCFPCSFMQEHADYALLAPFFCVMHYRLTGNRNFLKEVFGGIRAMLLWYRDAYSNAQGLLSNLDKWCIVEWPENARDGYDAELPQGKVCGALHNAVNALYIGACKNLNKIASLTGEGAVIDPAPVEKAFIKTFYDPASGLFKDSEASSHISLPGNAYPLLFGICPGKEAEQRAVSFISGKGLGNVSFYISFAALAGLVRAGRRDLCTRLICSNDSWLRMIRNGATTTWEAWDLDGKWNTSLFHLAFTLAFIFLADWDMEKVFD